ncbi:hypothetical protein NDN08_004830 [Rhodosorus marinus]|uniref:Uncharacterized protein n=1 Tax=Rhodosorus marinus TaxID=101924 RepID=A0AAV8UME3_9RHOD|nr:hypothetical protein NDN08_004830 [Rhodosorus marinus]
MEIGKGGGSSVNINASWLFLSLMYLVQGIPLGLAAGSVSYLLKSSMTYSEVAIFSFATWPYALKLFWSPVVDGFYWSKLGRRRSWILPVQILIGLTMIYISQWIDCYLPGEECSTQGPRPEAPGIRFITFWFFILVLLSATQDIALDGWALELLPESDRHLASSAQTMGLTGGFFLSFTVLLSLSSRAFVREWLPFLEGPPITISGYIRYAGIAAATMSVFVLLVPEYPPTEELDVMDVYRKLVSVVISRRDLLLVLLVHKLGFVANDAASSLLLLERGFRREDFALTAMLDFPVQLVVGLIVTRWSKKRNPVQPWVTGQLMRLALCFIMNVFIYYAVGRTSGLEAFFPLVVSLSILTSVAGTVMFISQGAFFAVISDSAIGGSYQTLLNTFSNFGGTWPKFFVLRAIDYFNVEVCDSMSNCVRTREGYVPVSFATVSLGALLFAFLVRPRIQDLVQSNRNSAVAKDKMS